MRYVIFVLVMLVLCFAAGSAFAVLWNTYRKKHGKAPLKTGSRVGISLGTGAALIVILSFSYLGIYYRADKEARDCLSGVEGVRVRKLDRNYGYFLDGEGTQKALIFYPGGKVETESYAPLMCKLAQKGVDVFLVDMPFHMPLFGKDRAQAILDRYEYPQWVLSGHSLGGVMASDFYHTHPDRLGGLILLASYTGGEILQKESRLLSVYGSEDGCLNRELYEADKSSWPADSEETVLEGGNHCQFGNYGFQRGDREALISREEQQAQTVEAILSFM